MTDAQWDYLDTYLRDLGDRMGLRDWTLILKRDPPDTSGAGAQVEPFYGRKRAWIRLSLTFDSYTPDVQRHTFIHELVHCHTDRMDNVLRSLEPALGTVAFGIAKESHNIADEDAVDALADVIAPFMPECSLPPA